MVLKRLFTKFSVAEARVKAFVNEASRSQSGDTLDTKKAVVELGEKAIDPLLRALKSKNHTVRHHVCYAIGMLGPCALPRLIAALESARPEARKEIACAIAKIDDPSTIPILTKLLVDPDRRVRWEVAFQMQYKNDPKVIEALVGALDQTDNGFRVLVEVAESLVTLGWSPQTKEHEILFDVLHLASSVTLFRPDRECVPKITRHGKAAVKHLLMVLEERERPNDSARKNAVKALLEIGIDERVLPTLKDLVERVQQEDGYHGDLLKEASIAIAKIKGKFGAGPRPKPSLGRDAPKSAMEKIVTKDDLHVGNIIRIWHEYLNQWATGWLLVEEFLGEQIVFFDYNTNDRTTRYVSDSIPCWRDPASKNRS